MSYVQTHHCAQVSYVQAYRGGEVSFVQGHQGGEVSNVKEFARLICSYCLKQNHCCWKLLRTESTLPNKGLKVTAFSLLPLSIRELVHFASNTPFMAWSRRSEIKLSEVVSHVNGAIEAVERNDGGLGRVTTRPNLSLFSTPPLLLPFVLLTEGLDQASFLTKMVFSIAGVFCLFLSKRKGKERT